jgi:hypothetical protein
MMYIEPVQQQPGDNLVVGMQAKLWSLSSLAIELGRNVRTISRALTGVAPDGKIGKHDGWLMATASKALQEYEARSTERWCGNGLAIELFDKIERLAAEIEEGLERLRCERDHTRRLALLRGFGAKVSALDRAMETANASQGMDCAHVLKPFRDRVVGGIVREIKDLLQAD